MSKQRNRHGNKPLPPVSPSPSLKPVNKIHQAFTQKYLGKTNQIITDVKLTPPFDPKDYPGKSPYTPITKKALWDTGATNSVIKGSVATELGLVSVGVVEVSHGGGKQLCNKFLLNIILPNKVLAYSVLVTEGPETLNGFDVIIGMDIIIQGDFAITNIDGKTCVSFRLPSMGRIDFVEELNRLNAEASKQKK